MPSGVVDSVAIPSHPDISAANAETGLDKPISECNRQKLGIRLITNPQQVPVGARSLELEFNVDVEAIDSVADTTPSHVGYTLCFKTFRFLLACVIFFLES